MSSERFFYTFYKKRGNTILFSYRKNGKKYNKKLKGYKPSLFFPTDNPQEAEFESIYGEPLKRRKFDTIKDAKNFGDDYVQMGGKFHGNRLFENQMIIEMFEGQMPKYSTSDIDVAIFDIETDYDEFPDAEQANFQIQQIDLKSTKQGIHFSFGLKEYKHNPKHKDTGHLQVRHTTYESETELLKGFIRHIEECQYDLLTGWNSEQFDVPYVINRCKKVLGDSMTNRLSPFGLIYDRTITNDFGNQFTKYEIVGLPHIDYMEAYKKHTFEPRENHKLDFIGQEELGERKVEFDGTLKELWENDPNEYIRYNIQDVELIHRLDKKLGLLDLTFTLAYITLSNYEDTLGTTKIWEQFIAKHLYNNQVAPVYAPVSNHIREFEGAFVHPTQSGRHNWIISFDLKSLYPHIIQQTNIGPETIVPYNELPEEVKALVKPSGMVQSLLEKKIDTSILDKHNLSMAANGTFYRKDKQSFMAQLMYDVYQGRVEYKSQMKKADKEGDSDKVAYYDCMQMGMKILLNSLYGAAGNAHFLYFMVDTAEAITMSGQLVNKWCSYKTNDFLGELFGNKINYLTSGDTDSFYASVAPIGDKLIKSGMDKDKVVDKVDELCGVISKKLEGYCEDLCDYLNNYKQAMFWEREVIAESGILVAKKKYVMKVLDDEGKRVTDKPKWKIMGMESVKSSTPAWAKKMLVESYKTCIDGEESDLHGLVEGYRDRFYKLNASEIAIPTGVNNILKYSDDKTLYKKGTPKNVKAVLVHNMLVDQKGVRRIPKILKDGSKIKWLPLRKPNPVNQEVVGFDGELPPEFELEKFVDRETVFESGFLKPLDLYLEVIGWNHEHINTLI